MHLAAIMVVLALCGAREMEAARRAQASARAQVLAAREQFRTGAARPVARRILGGDPQALRVEAGLLALYSHLIKGDLAVSCDLCKGRSAAGRSVRLCPAFFTRPAKDQVRLFLEATSALAGRRDAEAFARFVVAATRPGSGEARNPPDRSRPPKRGTPPRSAGRP